ncbi:MAG TPA: membrane dipeptidase [Polyangiaceae bacterium]|nr:membrane dipeptidase [Polyangiaceae bacterium]
MVCPPGLWRAQGRGPRSRRVQRTQDTRGKRSRSETPPSSERHRYASYLAAYTTYSRTQWRFATLADYLDAVDYAVRLVGDDHVGLSSDFNHGGGVVGFAHVGEAPNVTRELLRRGYTAGQVRKLWGANFLRVLRQAQEGEAL